jgi:hypothetical protein
MIGINLKGVSMIKCIKSEIPNGMEMINTLIDEIVCFVKKTITNNHLLFSLYSVNDFGFTEYPNIRHRFPEQIQKKLSNINHELFFIEFIDEYADIVKEYEKCRWNDFERNHLSDYEMIEEGDDDSSVGPFEISKNSDVPRLSEFTAEYYGFKNYDFFITSFEIFIRFYLFQRHTYKDLERIEQEVKNIGENYRIKYHY